MSDEQLLPINDQTYVVMRTSRVRLAETDLFIEVAFKNINKSSDEFVLDVSILRAMQYRPSTLWLNGKLIGAISSAQVEHLTNGSFKLIQSQYTIYPISLSSFESKETIVPTIMLENNQVKFQSVELMFATYGAHELIQDLIRFTPDEVLKRHSKEGYAAPAFNIKPYEIYLKRPAWNHNVFAYSLLANIRHNALTYGRVEGLNKQFHLLRKKSEDKFLITGVPWQAKPFTVAGNVLKNSKSGEEYLWSITSASVDSGTPIKQLIDCPSSNDADKDRKKRSTRVRIFVPVEPVIVDATPGRNDGEFVTPFKTTLIGVAPIAILSPVPKEKNSSEGSGDGQKDAKGSSVGSGNDPHGSNKGVASITTGTSQNDFFSDNMRLLYAASKQLVPAEIESIEWVVNNSFGLFTEPACLYFDKTEQNKDWVVVAKRDNEESYRFVLLFKFNRKDKPPVYLLELDSDQPCCVLLFRLHRKATPYILSRVMRIIAAKKGVMYHVGKDNKLDKLGVFKSKKHWTMLDGKADKEEWTNHVADWIKDRLYF